MRFDLCAACGQALPGFGAHASHPVSGVTTKSEPADAALIADLVFASRILAQQGVLDAFGHVSVRHPSQADRFLMSRSMAPALVSADDILEHDLDGKAFSEASGVTLFLERFIHCEIYRSRPDVTAIVHSHSPSVVPFGLVAVPLRPMYHNAAFLGAGVPVFDISQKFGATDMLVGTAEKGKALVRCLSDKPAVLMRGHGSVVVGSSLPTAVFRAIMTEVNARLQTQATILAGNGAIAALDEEESRLADIVNDKVVGRPWELWKKMLLSQQS